MTFSCNFKEGKENGTKRGFSFAKIIFGIIAVLVSCNMEQAAIIVLGTLELYNLIYTWGRKINYSALAEMLAAVAGAVLLFGRLEGSSVLNMK